MQYRRDKTKGACYFFTVVTHQRQPILTLPKNIERLREGFRREQNKNRFTIDAIVILPDHLHCLWQLPENDDDYSGRWSRIKRYFSTGCTDQQTQPDDSRNKKREKAIWQRRFWEHKIRDDRDWQNHMDYIHYNPVKHTYVDQVKDWPYSSFLRNVERGWYKEEWGCVEPDNIKNMHLE